MNLFPSRDTHTYDYFGGTIERDHDLCPHCGKRGNVIDKGDIVWNERPVAHDTDYICATCGKPWTIRRFIPKPFDKYPGPPYACIYEKG